MEVQEIQEGPGEFGKPRGVHCFCLANSKACRVFISLSPAAFLPYFSRPELLTPPRPTAGGRDRFPMLTFSAGQVFCVATNSGVNAANGTGATDGRRRPLMLNSTFNEGHHTIHCY